MRGGKSPKLASKKAPSAAAGQTNRGSPKASAKDGGSTGKKRKKKKAEKQLLPSSAASQDGGKASCGAEGMSAAESRKDVSGE